MIEVVVVDDENRKDEKEQQTDSTMEWERR